MQMRTKRLNTLVCATAAVALVAGGIGYYAGQSNVSSTEAGRSADVDTSAPLVVPAVNDNGDLENLTPAQVEVFEENSTPIDPDTVVFPENESLSEAEVTDRQLDMIGQYEVGEPLTPEDLEFLRAYLIEDSSAQSSSVITASYDQSAGQPTVQRASTFVPASDVDVVPVISSTTPFNRSKTAIGTSVNIAGSGTMRISEPGPFDNYWGCSWTAKRTSGTALTKITSSVTADAYGAVAAWPFVGLIYTKTMSGSTTTSQSYYFSRSSSFGGAVVQLNLACRSYFYNPSGTFQLP